MRNAFKSTNVTTCCEEQSLSLDIETLSQNLPPEKDKNNHQSEPVELGF